MTTQGEKERFQWHREAAAERRDATRREAQRRGATHTEAACEQRRGAETEAGAVTQGGLCGVRQASKGGARQGAGARQPLGHRQRATQGVQQKGNDALRARQWGRADQRARGGPFAVRFLLPLRALSNASLPEAAALHRRRTVRPHRRHRGNVRTKLCARPRSPDTAGPAYTLTYTE